MPPQNVIAWLVGRTCWLATLASLFNWWLAGLLLSVDWVKSWVRWLINRSLAWLILCIGFVGRLFGWSLSRSFGFLGWMFLAGSLMGQSVGRIMEMCVFGDFVSFAVARFLDWPTLFIWVGRMHRLVVRLVTQSDCLLIGFVWAGHFCIFHVGQCMGGLSSWSALSSWLVGW